MASESSVSNGGKYFRSSQVLLRNFFRAAVEGALQNILWIPADKSSNTVAVWHLHNY